jgi:hypothetical protein
MSVIRLTAALLGMLVLAGLGAPVAPAHAQTIWREGTSADRHAIHPHPWWYDKVKNRHLSERAWLSNFSDDHEGIAEYDIDIDEGAAGSYTLWVRANPMQARLSFRVGEGQWRAIDTDNPIDLENIAEDGQPDLRFIAWLHAGEVELPAGQSTLTFRMHSDLHNHGAIDVIALTRDGWVPDGLNRPDGKPAAVGGASPDAWAFNTDVDPFADSPIDLRRLNEDVAGQHGFVRLSEDGNAFVRGDGKPIRFWAINTSVQYRHDDEALARHARWLARMGFNMVRMHGSINPKEEGAAITDIDEEDLDRLWRLVAAMKKEGIYVTYSPFWAHGGHSRNRAADWGFEGYDNRTDIWGLMFFEPALEEAYMAWTTQVLTRVNPYTGIALKDDPALAIMQVKNEDSLLFWTTNGIRGEPRRNLERRFGQWLTRRYGSLQQALEAWDHAGVEDGGDDLADGRVAIENLWHLTQPHTGGRAKRLDDQLRFLAELQRGFYERVEAHFRDLGARQLVNTGNWTTADKALLEDLERWTYAGADVIAANRYYDPDHRGENHGWRIDPGHTAAPRSATRNPAALPTNLKQPLGRPMIMTESTWVNPSPYQSEAPLMIAAYQSLTGLDAYFWFATGEPTYHPDPYFPWWEVRGSHPKIKWNVAQPGLMDQFPAAALAYRMGYLQQGEPVIVEHRPLDAMIRRRPPVIAETFAYDPTRYDADHDGAAAVAAALDPLAFLVGPVRVDFADEGKTTVADLSDYIDAEARTVRSNTGEIELDYGTGLFRVTADRVQGLAGFLREAGGTFELPDATVESDNDYASVTIVSLDGEPLSESRHILVQVGTPSHPTGWRTRSVDPDRHGDHGETFEVISTGRMPWLVEPAHVRVTLNNTYVTQAVRLDEGGREVGDVSLQQQADGVTLAFPRDAIYVVLRATE